jgi:hypothetical protein
MNEAEDLADLAWSTPEELRRSVAEMFRRAGSPNPPDTAHFVIHPSRRNLWPGFSLS